MHALIALFVALATPVVLAAAEPIRVTVEGIDTDGYLHKQYAQCIPTIDGKGTRGENLRPTIGWTAGPEATKSYAIIVSDPDVPADLSIANQDELLIAEDMPRQTLYHWVQFNIGAGTHTLPGGERPPGFGRAAANDVSRGTDVYGYGGPCPPWNDAQLHRYHFSVHALDTAKLSPAEDATAASVAALIEEHSLAHGTQTALYTLNPALSKGL